ncbi:MAG: hypothetical protein R3A50_02435 [Saprospiraceae bacterium]
MKPFQKTIKLTGIFLMIQLFNVQAHAQDIFYFKNPNFEKGIPQMSKAPEDWKSLGEKEDSPVDIQPGFWGVNIGTIEGKQYVGMVVRDDGTTEGIGQQLDGFLLKDSSYTFRAYVGRSDVYESQSPRSKGITDFHSPVILEVWGYNSEIDEYELFDKTIPIKWKSGWVAFDFLINPQLGNYDEIDIMVKYAPGHEYENGHLLIDDLTPIVKMK